MPTVGNMDDSLETCSTNPCEIRCVVTQAELDLAHHAVDFEQFIASHIRCGHVTKFAPALTLKLIA